jgi:hypothetical protein
VRKHKRARLTSIKKAAMQSTLKNKSKTRQGILPQSLAPKFSVDPQGKVKPCTIETRLLAEQAGFQHDRTQPQFVIATDIRWPPGVTVRRNGKIAAICCTVWKMATASAAAKHLKSIAPSASFSTSAPLAKAPSKRSSSSNWLPLISRRGK